jgi:hypothetical protein
MNVGVEEEYPLGAWVVIQLRMPRDGCLILRIKDRSWRELSCLEKREKISLTRALDSTSTFA